MFYLSIGVFFSGSFDMHCERFHDLNYIFTQELHRVLLLHVVRDHILQQICL